MYLSKKGDNLTYGTIVTLIVVLVVAAIMFLWITKGGSEVQKKLSDDKCTASIQGAASSKRFPSLSGIGRPTVKLDCPKKELLITKSEIVDGDKINLDTANQIIADAMLSCWKKVGSGKIDPFANWDNEKISYCLICDEIVFDDALIEFIKNAKDDNERLEKRSIKGLTEFLMSKSPGTGQKSYFEQLYSTTRLVSDKKENNILTPGSVILVQMHKLESKSGETFTYGLISGGLLITIGIGGAFFTGGLSLVGVGAILGYGTIAAVGAYDLFSVTEMAFSQCKECNAIGGVAIVPYETSFQEKIIVKDINGKELYRSNRCDVLVN